jgi:hypothetical protein
MPPEARQRLQSSQRNIERTLESNQEALRFVSGKKARYSRALTTSGAELRSAQSALRKAGYRRKG